MASNYDNSAWFYDRLSRMIYGKTLIHSQICLLPSIPAGATILIAGGGTGWILEEIAKIHPSGLNITYAEVSVNMINLSYKRTCGTNKVTYINDAVENIVFEHKFDVVITPFLLDNFTNQTLQKVFTHLHCSLKSEGIWLNADFHLGGKWWQSLLLGLMILFFKVMCHIEATKPTAIKNQFELKKYNTIIDKYFYREFILSTVYQKTKL